MFKNLIHKFLVSKKNDTTNNTSANKNNTDDVNAITFILDKNNEPYIHISITDLDYDKAIFFSRMLFEMNSGAYASSIADILDQLSKQDDSIKIFISKVMAGWKLFDSFNKPNNGNSDPVVKPTDFFKSLTNE